jgi:hypothetical protein
VDKWLDKELVEAVAAGASSIICLGKEVETTIKEWQECHQEVKVKIFYLPHPSRANNGVWYSVDSVVRKKNTCAS